MALYFEDCVVGQELRTVSRTITEADVVNFGCYSGDLNPVHFDEEFAKSTQFQSRIAHGLLGLSYCVGLIAQSGTFAGTAIALMEIISWKFLAPIFIGDTVYCAVSFTEKIETSKPDRGIVIRKCQLINQRGGVVQEGMSRVMIKKRGQG